MHYYKMREKISIPLRRPNVTILMILNVWHVDKNFLVGSVQLKPGLDIGNGNPGPISVLVTEPKLFYPNSTPFFKIFLILSSFSAFSVDINFIKLKIGSRSSKMN